MTCRRHILLCIALSATFVLTSHAQPPLRQCVGSKAQFAVTGDTLSTFRVSVTGGRVLSSARNDSIVVRWGLKRGLKRISVQETSYGGCQGEEVALNVELVGTPFYFPKKKRRICPGDTMFIPIDARLYKVSTVRWSDPDVATRGIVQPGGYRVWVEDVEGCRYTDSITVAACQPVSQQRKQP